MRNVLSSLTPSLLLLVALIGPPKALAESWYAQAAPDGQSITTCLHWKESVVESVAALEKQFGSKCEFRVDKGYPIYGYFYRCGANNNQFLFRSSEICELFKNNLNAGKPTPVDDVVPKGLKNPGGYIAAFLGCIEKGYTPAAVATSPEKLGTTCDCMARQMGSRPDAEITKEFASAAIGKCFISGSNPGLAAKLDALPSEKDLHRKSKGGKKTLAAKAPAAVASPSSSPVVRAGDTYEKAQAKLTGIEAEKKQPSGDYLWVTYKQPELLAYPDAGGECKLTYFEGKLQSCEGCSLKRFSCH